MFLIKWIVFGVVAVFLHFLWVRVMKRYRIRQQIYDLSPKRHQAKAQTPSFGGVSILAVLALGIFLMIGASPTVLWLGATTLAFALIGFADDWISQAAKQNKGLTVKQKFLVQCGVAVLSVAAYWMWIFPLTWQLAALYVFLMVGFSNAANLTDGLDGLLSGSATISFIGFVLLAMWYGEVEISAFAGLMAVTLGAFTVWNRYPARIFMGDTGSLAIGAALTATAMALQHPWLLAGLGFVYGIETLSVIIQVIGFKLTKTRIFKMSPLHHHFELSGMAEPVIVRRFWIVSTLAMMATVAVAGGMAW